MCGIAGIIRFNGKKVGVSELKKLTDEIAHRGPDGEGFWLNDEESLGFGHRRLSILDLSTDGKQPMNYAENRYTITYNGEIYNYLEIKAHLKAKGYCFYSETDTEVVLAAFDYWGKSCLSEFEGMFAFAIWDDKKKELFCARDRFGEKPFFYFHDGEQLIFASEIKALFAIGIKKELNHRMGFNFLYNGAERNPKDLSETFYKNIFSLEHSTFLAINPDNLLRKERYYHINYKEVDYSIRLENAQKQFKELLYNSISHRLRSDVMVGSSLSGGLDSSTIVSIINELNVDSTLNQKVFSAYFKGFKKDEKQFIEHLIQKYKLDAHFIDLGKDNFSDVLEAVIHAQDEPIGSLSTLAQYKVMKLSKENNVKVLLDGQGADEILGGYHWYFNSYFKELFFKDKASWKTQYNCYRELHKGNSINELRSSQQYKYYLKRYLPFLHKLAPKTQKLNFPTRADERDYYENYKKYKFQPVNEFNSLNEELHNNVFCGPLQSLLKYSDRNSMANSVEVRLPYLNYKLVEFVFRLPSTMKINKGWTKWILRDTMSDLLPNEIAWKKEKIGFEPPKNTAVFDYKFELLKKYYKLN